MTDAMTDKTILVSIMLANNEIGVVQHVDAIGAAIKAKNPKTLFHIDAVQGAGKVPFDVEKTKVDLVAVTAHKMYGPKGVGALWVRRKPRVRIDPIIDGGGHERGMRSGTLNGPADRRLRQGGRAREGRDGAPRRSRLARAARPALPRHHVRS